jgi:hypothetical protein
MNDNNFYLSLDASSSVIGWTLWDSKGKMLKIDHIELDKDKTIPVEDRDIYKANLFKEYLILFKKELEEKLNGKLINVFIEEPLPSTKINLNTVNLLISINGMYRFIIFEIFGFYPTKISVYDSRKIFCPEFIKKVKEKGVFKEVLSFPKGWKSPEKKQYIQEKVAKLEPNIQWIYNRNNKLSDENFDRSDSYCVGYSSLKILGIIE